MNYYIIYNNNSSLHRRTVYNQYAHTFVSKLVCKLTVRFLFCFIQIGLQTEGFI